MSCRTKEQESIRKFPGKCSGKRRKTGAGPQSAAAGGSAATGELPRGAAGCGAGAGATGLQEISDELERLSGRYQTRMEEWLDDQSAI